MRIEPNRPAYRYGRELMFDYDKNVRIPDEIGRTNKPGQLIATQLFFKTFSSFPINYAETITLYGTVAEVKLRLLHELAHLLRLGVSEATDGNARKFALNLIEAWRNDVVVCHGKEVVDLNHPYYSQTNLGMGLYAVKTKLSEFFWDSNQLDVSDPFGIFHFQKLNESDFSEPHVQINTSPIDPNDPNPPTPTPAPVPTAPILHSFNDTQSPAFRFEPAKMDAKIVLHRGTGLGKFYAARPDFIKYSQYFGNGSPFLVGYDEPYTPIDLKTLPEMQDRATAYTFIETLLKGSSQIADKSIPSDFEYYGSDVSRFIAIAQGISDLDFCSSIAFSHACGAQNIWKMNSSFSSTQIYHRKKDSRIGEFGSPSSNSSQSESLNYGFSTLSKTIDYNFSWDHVIDDTLTIQRSPAGYIQSATYDYNYTYFPNQVKLTTVLYDSTSYSGPQSTAQTIDYQASDAVMGQGSFNLTCEAAAQPIVVPPIDL